MPWVLGTGGLIGGTLATWLGPRAISWYFTPPAQFGFNCAGPIEWALQRFQWLQGGGILIGGLIALLVYLKFRRPSSSIERTETL